MIDKIILIVCGVLFVLLTAVLIWWLVIGKQRFIEKRCPERLIPESLIGEAFCSHKSLIIGGDGKGKKVVIENHKKAIESPTENKEVIK